MKYDSVLLVAFGGPTPGCCKKYDNDNCPGEAYCFVEGIAGEAESQKERVKDISSHYVKLGGFSPFNELTFKQAKHYKSRYSSEIYHYPFMQDLDTGHLT